MKIIHNDQSSLQIFRAGLTSNMQRSIAECNASKISNELLKYNIISDFKENKVIAWCSMQCINLIKELNNRFKLNFGLPNQILVEDFHKLKVKDVNALGFLNFAPTILYKDKEQITQANTIIFNEFEADNSNKKNHVWDKIDEIADRNFEDGISTTDYFLETFLHEFTHAIHASHMIKKINGIAFIKTVEKMLKTNNILIENRDKIKEALCCYAITNPIESVACDISKRIICNLDKDTLLPIQNCIKNSPYTNSPFFLKLLRTSKKEDIIFKFLNNAWNGKI